MEVKLMFSIRLPGELEEKIKRLAKKYDASKSEIVREAIEDYVAKEETKEKPYELGKDLFGLYGSDEGNLSEAYKQKVKKKLNEKHPD